MTYFFYPSFLKKKQNSSKNPKPKAHPPNKKKQPQDQTNQQKPTLFLTL